MIKNSVLCLALIAMLGVHTSVAGDHAETSLLRRALKPEGGGGRGGGGGGGGRGGPDNDQGGDRPHDQGHGEFNMTDSDDEGRKGRGNETDLGMDQGGDSGKGRGHGDFNMTDSDDEGRKGRGHETELDVDQREDSGKGRGHGDFNMTDSDDEGRKGRGNETDLGISFDQGKTDKGRKVPGGRKHDFTGHGGRNKKNRDFGGKPFGIEFAAIDCPLKTATERECTGGRGEPGAWVCRTLFDVITGKPYSFTTCIDVDESIGASNDVCGCCGECPTVCSCPCDAGEGKKGSVKVLDAENPEGEGHCVIPKVAMRMTSGAGLPGLLAPRHICDESCK